MAHFAELRQDYHAITQETSQTNVNESSMTNERPSPVSNDHINWPPSRYRSPPQSTVTTTPALDHPITNLELQAKQRKLKQKQQVLEVLQKRHHQHDDDIARLSHHLHQCTQDIHQLQRQYDDAKHSLQQETTKKRHLHHQLATYRQVADALTSTTNST